MATNLSLFPDQIDSFIRHSDVGSADLANINRYQELTLKDSLTTAESEEMTTLLSMLRDKIWTAEDLNKIQDCMTNLETFFKYQTEEYITELFEQYNYRMALFDVRVDQMRTDVDNKIVEANTKILEMEATRAELITTVYDSTYFDFDNNVYKSGFTRKTERISDTVTVETIYNTIDNSVFATRTTTKNGEQDYTIETICDRVVPAINTTSRMYKKDGIWYEQITEINYV